MPGISRKGARNRKEAKDSLRSFELIFAPLREIFRVKSSVNLH
jgi:hypothetical protein